RHAFTVIANLSVYTIIYFVIDTNSCTTGGLGTHNTTMHIMANTESTTEISGAESDCSELGPKDSSGFQTAAFVFSGIGLACSLLFQLGVCEKTNSNQKQEDVNTVERSSKKKSMKKFDWFKKSLLYQIALLYMV
ncbi:unnamed protein product, partial [Meganyctiphanes norvegica]